MKTQLLGLLAGMLVATAHAQTSLSWLTLDSGGGTSSSADYRASYTVGQPDAFQLASRSYGMTGGFWTVSGLTQPTAPPELHITRAGLNVTISWASPSTGYVLEENSSLSNPAGWSDVGTSPSDDGATKSVALPVASQPRYFRLRRD